MTQRHSLLFRRVSYRDFLEHCRAQYSRIERGQDIKYGVYFLDMKAMVYPSDVNQAELINRLLNQNGDQKLHSPNPSLRADEARVEEIYSFPVRWHQLHTSGY